MIDELRKKPQLLAALLVAATLLLYLPVLHHDFLPGWDDDDYVTQNIHVRSGLNPANVAWAFRSFECSNWHPVTWLSHMLDCQIFGLNSGAQHYVNVLLHAANVLLLFWILMRATGAVWRSFVVAALFAVHPLNVETVAWIAQRKSLLSAFFSLLTLAAYGCYLRKEGWQRYSLVVCAFAVALMSKPMAVSLPLLMLLFDYWPLHRLEELPWQRRWTRLIVEKFPLLVMCGASSVITSMAQGSGRSVMGLSLLSTGTRFENAAIAYVAYVGKIFWPARLGTFYPLELHPAIGDALASAIVLAVISALALYLRRARYIAVGWLFFVIALVPVVGIVQVGFQGMADRYTYIPSIGLFIATVWGLAAVAERNLKKQALLAFVAIFCISGFAVATAQTIKSWENGVTLFSQARSAWGRPHFWIEQLYGNALFSAGRTDDAMEHYQESCALYFSTPYCHYGTAHILLSRRQYRPSIREYQLAVQFAANPQMRLLCLDEMSEALLNLGEYDAAEKSLADALAIDPANATAMRLQQALKNRAGGS